MRLSEPSSWPQDRREPAPQQPADRSGGVRVWAIGGGKGGIGKSFLAANAATVAARSGRRVMLVDADLGAANLHTCLGVRSGPRSNLLDCLEGGDSDLERIAVETPVPNLRLILGALSRAGAAETRYEQRKLLMEQVRRLRADVVVFDLAAGTDRAAVDFFLEADQRLLLTTPEPTAIENAYGFLRASFFRLLAQGLRASHVRDLVREAMDRRNAQGIRSPADLLAAIERIDRPEAQRFQQLVADYRPRLVVNQVQTSDEVRLGFQMRSVCRKLFGIEIDYLGYINDDEHVRRSIAERRPLVLGYPQSDCALYVRQIVKKMLQSA
jgi:flagellar biosynthesis protein FlhG